MEKVGVAKEDLIQGLRDEEGKLMAKIAAYMSNPMKTAAEDEKYEELQSRLQLVREKITEHDLKKS